MRGRIPQKTSRISGTSGTWFPLIWYRLTNSENPLSTKVDCPSCISECYSEESWNFDEAVGWAQDNVSDSDMKARIIGVQTKMQTFSFFYGHQLAIVALSHSDSLSSSLQRAELCAVHAQKNAKLSLTVLRGIQSDRMQASIGPRPLRLL